MKIDLRRLYGFHVGCGKLWSIKYDNGKNLIWHYCILLKWPLELLGTGQVKFGHFGAPFFVFFWWLRNNTFIYIKQDLSCTKFGYIWIRHRCTTNLISSFSETCFCMAKYRSSAGFPIWIEQYQNKNFPILEKLILSSILITLRQISE